MDEADEANELRRLQARAYGRDADIADDPAAQARLAELERAHAPRPSVPASPRPGHEGAEVAGFRTPDTAVLDPSREVGDSSHEVGHASARGLGSGREGSEAAGFRTPDEAFLDPSRAREDPSGEGGLDAPGRGWAGSIRRMLDTLSPSRRTWLGAACIALAAVAVTAVVTALPWPDPRQVATIAVDADAPWPELLGERTPDAALFEDFHGLTVIRDIGWFSPEEDRDTCLVIVRSELLREEVGALQPVTWACGAGDFPPTLHMTVNPGQPEALRERFADGTGLEFVLDGDVVSVRADD